MPASKPHILFHRSNPWDSAIQCSTKTYAGLFQSAGYSVTYLQDLAHTGHWLLRRGYYHTWKKGCYWSGGVWVCGGLALIPSFVQARIYNPALVELSYRSCLPSLRQQIAHSGLPAPDVIWSTVPGSGALKKLFPESKLIMNVVDYYPAFHSDRVKRLECNDYSLSDHIFVTAHTLKDYLVNEFAIPLERITMLGQGVATERYAIQLDRPVDLPMCDGPVAVWVGVLQKADVEMMEEIAYEIGKRNGCVVLIGPPGEWDAHALQHECVVRLGPRPSSEVPTYLCHADIGLMLYDRSRASVYRGQNPLKLYEYLAAGLSVLSTPHDEYESMQPPVLTVRTPSEISEVVKTAINRKEELSIKAKSFAATYTWKNCFKVATEQISLLLS